MKTSVALLPVVAFACSPVAQEAAPVSRPIKVRLVADRPATDSPQARLQAQRVAQLARAETRAELENRALRGIDAAVAEVTVTKLPVRFGKPQVELPLVPTLPEYLEIPVASAAGEELCGEGLAARPCAPRL